MSSPASVVAHPARASVGVRALGLEILGLALVLIATPFAWRYRVAGSPASGLALGVVALAGMFLLTRRLWAELFGPVLFYDLLRVARRSRYIALRCAYAAMLAFLLYWLYSDWFSAVNFSRLRGAEGAKYMARFAEQYFNTFMVMQFAMVVILTPVYAASNITEEKERKTLEYLLATDLRSREIVLSKLVSRLANLALTILTGLPVLSILQFLGGVEPALLLAGFAATGLTMVSLASLSTLTSVYARKARDAILFTYLAIAAYMGVGYLLLQIQIAAVPGLAAPVIGFGASALSIEDLIDWFNAGNFPIAVYRARTAWLANKSLTDLILSGLASYSIFHGGLTLICTAWATARFRAVSLRQTSEGQVQVRQTRRPGIRPKLGLRPMVWKEVFVEARFRLTKMGWLVVAIFVLLSLMPAAWIVWAYYQGPQYSVGNQRAVVMGARVASVTEALNLWVRILGSTLGCLMLMAVAARASTSISGERDRDTLDALLTSPLRSHDILFGKWLGSLLSIRWPWLWLAFVWSIGIAAGALHPIMAVFFCVAWVVYASTLAGVGLWFSARCKTSLRATLCTLAACLLLGGGFFWAFLICALPLRPMRGLGIELLSLQVVFTPPTVFYMIAESPQRLGQNQSGDLFILGAGFGLFFWSLGALFLWTITRRRFRKISSRMPYHRPDARREPTEEERLLR